MAGMAGGMPGWILEIIHKRTDGGLTEGVGHGKKDGQDERLGRKTKSDDMLAVEGREKGR